MSADEEIKGAGERCAPCATDDHTECADRGPLADPKLLPLAQAVLGENVTECCCRHLTPRTGWVDAARLRRETQPSASSEEGNKRVKGSNRGH